MISEISAIQSGRPEAVFAVRYVHPKMKTQVQNGSVISVDPVRGRPSAMVVLQVAFEPQISN